MLVIVNAATFAQELGRVTGQVVDAASKAPVGQVQVYLQGTSVGTLSRQDGQYMLLNVPAGTHTIRAERIGMSAVTREVTVAAGEVVRVDFELASQALGLDEIVVTGAAGASRRREIGNTVSQIAVDQLPERPLTVSDALMSKAPGLQVYPGSGELGQGTTIRLRGNSSVSMSNQPIIYIDGVRMASSTMSYGNAPDQTGRAANVVPSALDMVNPNDIERIEVIKGSAATTLYGTEASAGVIQIFTKQGSAAAPIWTAETQQRLSWIPKFGVEPEPYNRLDPYLSRGHNQQYLASVRGGGQALQYFASGQFIAALGNLPSDSLNQTNVRGNFTFRPATDLQIQWNSGYSNRWQKNTPTGTNAHSITLNAWRGEVNYFGSDDVDVVSQLLSWQFDQDVERFTTGGTLTYSPLADLTNRFTIGYDMTNQEIRNFRPYGFPFYVQGGILVQIMQSRFLNVDYVGTYSRNLTEGLRTSFSWGGQAVGHDERTISAWGEDIPGATKATVSSGAFTLGTEQRQKVWNAGMFVQNVFDLHDKYFVTLGVRVDGNSAFGKEFGLQAYPKVSGTWVASDEDFWRPAWGEMRLRAAYGQSGRAPGAFDAVRTWNSSGWVGESVFTPQNVGNPDLGPEVTGEFEAGFDSAWFDGRIRPSLTYYRQITTDALFDVGQMPSLGFSRSQRLNVGKTLNKGVELGLETSPIQRPEWGLDIGVNLSTNNSEVLDLGGAPEFSVGGGWIIEGHPIGVRRGRVLTNPNEVVTESIACSATRTTDCLRYEDNVIIGPPLPTYSINAHSTLRLPRGITLSANGEYKGGHYIHEDFFAINRAVRSPLCYPYYANPETSIKLKADAEIPALWRARCTPGLEDGAYWWDLTHFRLRGLTASIPVDFAFPSRISSAVLALGIDNPYLWMKDLPMGDPEGGNHTRGDAGSTPTEGIGVSSHRLPVPRSAHMSLRVTF